MLRCRKPGEGRGVQANKRAVHLPVATLDAGLRANAGPPGQPGHHQRFMTRRMFMALKLGSVGDVSQRGGVGGGSGGGRRCRGGRVGVLSGANGLSWAAARRRSVLSASHLLEAWPYEANHQTAGRRAPAGQHDRRRTRRPPVVFVRSSVDVITRPGAIPGSARARSGTSHPRSAPPIPVRPAPDGAGPHTTTASSGAVSCAILRRGRHSVECWLWRFNTR